MKLSDDKAPIWLCESAAIEGGETDTTCALVSEAIWVVVSFCNCARNRPEIWFGCSNATLSVDIFEIWEAVKAPIWLNVRDLKASALIASICAELRAAKAALDSEGTWLVVSALICVVDNFDNWAADSAPICMEVKAGISTDSIPANWAAVRTETAAVDKADNWSPLNKAS